MSTQLPVTAVPVERLRTSLAVLRGGGEVRVEDDLPLAPLPIRVVAQDDGFFEVVDGFKRLRHWLEEGRTSVPAVIERATSAVELKHLVLRANAPPRTLTPMDEARVIDALRREDGLSLGTIARLLGRRQSWVTRRHALVTRLAPALQLQVGRGLLKPSLAAALCALTQEDQLALFRVIVRHGLKEREALALVAASRATGSPAERTALLRDPWPALRPTPPTSPLRPSAVVIEQRLDHIREALRELASFELPAHGLEDAERRRLEAQHRSVVSDLDRVAQTLAEPGAQPKEDLNVRQDRPPTSEPTVQPTVQPAATTRSTFSAETTQTDHPHSRGATAGPPPLLQPLRHTSNRTAPGPRPQDRPPLPPPRRLQPLDPGLHRAT